MPMTWRTQEHGVLLNAAKLMRILAILQDSMDAVVFTEISDDQDIAYWLIAPGSRQRPFYRFDCTCLIGWGVDVSSPYPLEAVGIRQCSELSVLSVLTGMVCETQVVVKGAIQPADGTIEGAL